MVYTKKIDLQIIYSGGGGGIWHYRHYMNIAHMSKKAE